MQKGFSSNKYYQKDLKEIFKEFSSGEYGLSKNEARKRLLENGSNKIPEAKPDGFVVIFLRQFQSPLILILFLAALIVFWSGENIDGAIILIVLLFNATIGTIQEGKAQNVFLALKKFAKTKASVIRNGEEYIISDEGVVVGDVIILREGEKIPADARLISTESLQIEEAAITGESDLKIKKTKKITNNKKIQISEQDNMVFKGTSVASGVGKAIVVATGKDTFIGGMVQKVSKISEELPLKKDIRFLSKIIIVIVASICAAFFGIGLIYGQDIKELFSASVAIAVSIIPEGLPIVVTLVLATGAWRMGKQNILIKKMQAVEALGQTDIIALDKTGTLTKNELTVKEIYANNKKFDVEGAGYKPEGKINLNNKNIYPINYPEILTIGKIGALCSGAHLAFDKDLNDWKVSGDPTEAATLVLAEKIGLKKFDLEKEFIKIDEKSFDYKLKYHTVLYKFKEKETLMTIGAPEEVLNISNKIWENENEQKLNSEKKKELQKFFSEMSSRGLRVLALGQTNFKNKNKIPNSLPPLTFVGFLGIEDPPRLEAKEALEKIETAGIGIAIITGDHKITAKAIGEEVGILKKNDIILEGTEIDEMSDNELAKKIKKVRVFARVTPLHKLKIIDAYKKSGKIVAMTGDGVNDALSLASADVGVAMGRIGTEVAKEAADIVLLDDNFGNIVAGIEEGKNILKTIKRVVLYLFSTGVGEVLAILGAVLLGFPLPVLAAQILWLNLITDGFIDMALAMEPKKKNSFKERSFKKEKIVDRTMVARIITMALPMALGTLFLFSQNFESDLKKAWTISLTTLAVFQWFNAWNCRSVTMSIFKSNPFSNKFLLGALAIVISLQFLAVYNPFFQKVLRTVPLRKEEWGIIIIMAFSVIVFEEVRKIFHRKRNKTKKYFLKFID